jgi:photosystem II stability/assembly factor-like uncharacterized protein
MKIYLLPFFLLAVSALSAQPLRYDKFFRVDDYSAMASSIQQTSDGGFIIAGRLTEYDSTITFPDTRALLLRIDAEGNTLWYKSYGTSSENYLVSVYQTPDGGFIACGVSNGIYPGKLAYDDHWLMRTDANGDSLWMWQYGSFGDGDELSGLFPLPGGDYLLYGSIYPSTTRQAYLARVDSNGGMLWERSYSKPDHIFGVASASNGGFALVGDATLLLVDSVGRRLRDTSYPSRFEEIYQILQTSDGGYALAGIDAGGFWLQLVGVDSAGRVLWSSVHRQPSMSTGNPSFRATHDRGYIVVGSAAIGGDKRLVVKTDIVGKVLWSRIHDSSGFGSGNFFRSVAITPEHDLVMAGYNSISYQKVIPGSLPITRIDSEGYLVRPAPDRFWKRLHYTGGDAISSLTIDSAGTILVGEYTTTGRALLYRSTDDGLTWYDNNGPGYQYQAMVTPPDGSIIAIRTPDWLSKGADGSGGWRSTDHGATWNRLESFPTSYLSRLAVSRSGDLYAMGHGALHRSSNNGAGWDSVVVPDAALIDIAIAPNGTVYVTTDSLGILQSTDRGGTWSTIELRWNNKLILDVGQIAIRGNGDLFVSTGSSIDYFHSTDNGATWRYLDSTLSIQIAALAFDRYGAIYANTTTQSTNPGIWRTTDEGGTWTHLGDTTLNIRQMVVDRKGRMLGAGIGIFRTEEAVASVASSGHSTAESLSLNALPNPFSDETMLRYRLPVRSDITITIVDRMGRKIATLADGEWDAGEYRATWNSDGYAAGVYYCVMRAGARMRVEPLVVVR